jgi:hypothetical protein
MRRLLAAMGVCAVLSTGCYTAGTGGYYYDYTYYDPYWYGYDAAYAYSWVDPFGVTYLYLQDGENKVIDTGGVAQGIANAASSYYAPIGCANATVSGSTVTYNFVNCTGPFSLTNLNGGLTVVASESNGLLVLTASSNGLTINGTPLIVDSQTTVTSNGNNRSASIVSHTRDPGRVDSRDAQLTVQWVKGEACFGAAGTDTSVSSGTTSTTTLTDFRKCAAQCPATGTVSVVTPTSHFFAEFNGSNTLTVVDSVGNSKAFLLTCD